MSIEWSGWQVVRLAMTGTVIGLVTMLGGCASTGGGKGSVAERLQLAEDRLEIEQLMVGDYPLALDSRNWKAYAALFTEDGELISGNTVSKGRQAIEENFSRPRTPRTPPAGAAGAAGAQGSGAAPAASPAGPPQTKHIVTNLQIKIDGDRATATAYWQTISNRTGTTVIAGAGHYVDELKRENGQWRFSKREIVNPARPASAPAAAPATPSGS